MKDFKSLIVWEKSHHLTLLIYEMSRFFPEDEKYGLTSQIRRSVSSVSANIAEGCGRSSDKDFARFLQIAIGSASETEYHLLLARDLGFLNQDDWCALDKKTNEVKRMLINFYKKLQK